MPTTVQGIPLDRFSVSDFRGGLDVKSSPQELASNPKYRNRLSLSRHCEHRKTGGVSKRHDTATYNSVSLGASVGITGGFQLRLDDGTNVMICGTTDGRVVKLNSGGTTTDLATGKTTGSTVRWWFDKFANYAVISNRNDAPMKYDGTTFGGLGGSPPATGGPHAVHGNRVIFLDASNIRRFSWSALGDGEDYTTATNAGSAILTGRLATPLVFLLPMTNELLIGGRDLVTRLQGTSPSTYTLPNASPAMVSIGGISPQGAIFSNNDARWISQRGIHAVGTTVNFGDLEEKFDSERIDPYFTASTDFTVSLNQLAASVACYDSQNNRDLFGVDTDADGKNDTIFVRDCFTGAWSVWPEMSCASLWPAYNGTSGYEVFMGGYDGFVRRLNVDASTNAIDAAFSHITDLGTPGNQKTLRAMDVYAKEEGNHALTITVNADFGLTGGDAFAMSLLGNTATLGSTFMLGTSVLGAQSQIIKSLRMGILGEFFETTFSNAQAGQPFTVHKYTAFSRYRRSLRAQS